MRDVQALSNRIQEMYAYFPTLADQTPEPKDEGVKGLQPIGKRDADLQSLTGDEEQTITVGVGDGELATGHRNRIKRVGKLSSSTLEFCLQYS